MNKRKKNSGLLSQVLKLYSVLSGKQKIDFWILQIMLIILSFFEFVGIGSIVPYINILSNPDIVNSNSILSNVKLFLGYTNNKEFILFLGLCTIILVVVGNLFTLLSFFLTFRYGHKTGQEWNVGLFSYYLKKDYLYHTKNNTSKLMSNVMVEVGRVVLGIVVPILQANARVFLIMIFVGALILHSPLFSICIVFILLFVYGIMFFFNKNRLVKYGATISSITEKRFRYINEGLGGIKESIVNCKRDFYINKYRDTKDSYSNAFIMKQFLPITPKYFVEIIIFGGTVGVLLYLFQNKRYELAEIIPQLTFFVIVAYRTIPSLQQVFLSLSQVRSTKKPLEIILNDLIKSSKNITKPLTTNERISHGLIKLENIQFSYLKNKDKVIDGINLNIEPGTTIGLVGTTGSGKTTMVDILLGLLKPQKGHLIVGDIEITEDNISAWQNCLGYVPQDIFLTDNTIKCNIAFGVSENEINTNKINEVIKQAQLAEFISTLKDGVNTKVGERGVQLSGGQKQRIGIARALYREASLLVFDEATSALDGQTETALMNIIYSLRKKLTIVMIAHRLTTLRECDTIYVLDKGKIADKGSYNYMMKQCDIIKKMINLN